MWSASGLRTNLARLSDGRSSMAAWLRVVRGRVATRVAATRWRRATCFAVPLLTLLLLPAMGLAYHVFFDRSRLPDLESFIRFTPPTIGEVYDARGAVLIRLAREYRRVVSYDEVPPVLRHAILSAEDKHFFIHSGVDYRALPRVLQKTAGRSLAASGTGDAGFRMRLGHGGSTLTSPFMAAANVPRPIPRPDAPSRRDDAIATRRRPASPQAPGGQRDRASVLPGAHRP